MRTLLLLCFFTVSVLAEDKKPAPTPITPASLDRKDPIDYTKDVLPVFANKCTVCHSGTELRGKYDMGSHAAVLKGGKRGPAVVAGKPLESTLYVFSSHTKGPVMPPEKEENPLSPVEVAILKRWIEEGAKGPATGETRMKAAVALSLPPATVKPVRAVAVSPDKATVAAGKGNQLHLYDVKTGTLKKTFVDPTLKTSTGGPAGAAHISLVEALAFSPDGKTVATGSFQELTLWDTETGTVRKRLGGFAERVVAIVYSPDGKLLATGGGAPTVEGEVRVFTADGAPAFDLKAPHSDTVFGLCFSPDGKLLATAGADKFVKVWEVPGGKLTKAFEGHTQHVLDVGWTADGKRLASAGADNVIKVWDYEKGEKVRDINGHQKQVTRLVFVPKTPTFLTTGGDATVRLWNVDNGGQARSFGDNKDYLYAVATSADGTVVAAGGEEGVVRIYNGTNGQLLSTSK